MPAVVLSSWSINKRLQQYVSYFAGILAPALGQLMLRPQVSPCSTKLAVLKITGSLSLWPVQTTQLFLAVAIVTVSDNAILTVKLLSCRGKETCQTTRSFATIVFSNTCDVIKKPDSYLETKPCLKRCLYYWLFYFQKNAKQKERKPENGHVPGLLEDCMGSQSSKKNLR